MRFPRGVVAKAAVYAALTADMGLGERHPDTQADNVLDFNGLLHVDRVVQFVDALMAWRAEITRVASLQQPASRRCWMCGSTFAAQGDEQRCGACESTGTPTTHRRTA